MAFAIICGMRAGFCAALEVDGMKRLLALAMALALLLTAAACAESSSSIIVMDNLELDYFDGANTRTIRVPDLQVVAAVGMSGMTPSVQLSFSNGIGQEIDAVLQLVGTELMASAGGISSVFSYDLGRTPAGEKAVSLITLAISSSASLGGISLVGLLSTFTEEAEGGARVIRTTASIGGLVAALDNALQKAEGLDAAQSMDFGAIREKLHGLGDAVEFEFSFNPKSGKLSLTFAQEGRRLSLSVDTSISVEPFTYADIDLTADRVDVLSLSEDDIRGLNDELSMLFGRLLNHATAAGLSQYLPGM